jgi:hypothetical protein
MIGAVIRGAKALAVVVVLAGAVFFIEFYLPFVVAWLQK